MEVLASQASAEPLKIAERRKIDAEIRQVIAGLEGLLRKIDPVRQPIAVFDPSNPKIIGRFIALAMVAQARQPLTDIAPFYGSGVYAIYYRGTFDLYKPISASETPIYVGQAAPATNTARTPIEQGDRLSRRLSEHAKNIARASGTLDLSDFDYRALVVQSGHETAAEDYLIHLFKPIWNSETNILFGLGKHGDAAETRANKRSPWDTIHPGRQWASNVVLKDARTQLQISVDLNAHFKAHPIFKDIDQVLKEFIEELRQV